MSEITGYFLITLGSCILLNTLTNGKLSQFFEVALYAYWYKFTGDKRAKKELDHLPTWMQDAAMNMVGYVNMAGLTTEEAAAGLRLFFEQYPEVRADVEAELAKEAAK